MPRRACCAACQYLTSHVVVRWLRWILFKPVAWFGVTLCVFPVLHHPMRRVAPARYWYPKAASACLASRLASLLMPMRPWPAVRCLGQLMYEVSSRSLLPVSGALIYTVRSHYVGLAHVMSVALRYLTFTSANRL